MKKVRLCPDSFCIAEERESIAGSCFVLLLVQHCKLQSLLRCTKGFGHAVCSAQTRCVYLCSALQWGSSLGKYTRES